MPVSEYIFCTKAMPSIAALLLQLPCMNAPFCVSSFISNSVNIHTSENMSIVTMLQYKTNFGSNWLLKSDFDKSLNKSTGNATLKTYLFATLAKWSSIIPSFLITPPSSITRNTGTVALILYTKLSTTISIQLYAMYATAIYLTSTSFSKICTSTYFHSAITAHIHIVLAE